MNAGRGENLELRVRGAEFLTQGARGTQAFGIGSNDREALDVRGQAFLNVGLGLIHHVFAGKVTVRIEKSHSLDIIEPSIGRVVVFTGRVEMQEQGIGAKRLLRGFRRRHQRRPGRGYPGRTYVSLRLRGKFRKRHLQSVR